ncbi:MAG: DNA alkylation repair protein [Propionibacteriaceae bacterium]|jgi:3-methyladenine DNA glycosylase AlkD|nr:DNA alkylation repair protein [Propionibacteriaceae bacterium]
MPGKDVIAAFYANADPVKAQPMAAYMKHICPFLGIPKPERAALSKEFLKQARQATEIDWEFVTDCWGREREFQYLALDYLRAVASLLTPADVPRLRDLALIKPWWDTIDVFDRIIGGIALRFPAVNETLLAWSTDASIWLRRIAIDHQLNRKDRTDTALLEQIIVNNLGQREFFINKAIGWSLREYSKTDPTWVRAFLARHHDSLAPLSIREASKYL